MPEHSSRLQRNCLFWTCFSKLSTKDMLVRATVDAESYFLLPISQLCWNESFLRKAVLPRHTKRVSDSNGAASALLASASVPSSIRCGLGQRLVWASFWCGASALAHQGIALGVYKPVGSTPPLLAFRGSLGELIANDDRRVALR